MVILISKNSKTYSKEHTFWKDEYKLQDFVVDNAQIIFSKFLDDDTKICVIGKELVNENGKADILLLDQNGSLYIVETKLDSNSEKREIFAQLTGYMSAINTQSVYPNFGDFIEESEESINNKLKFSGSFDEYIQKKFDMKKENIEEIKNNLENNIKENSIYGIIIMDIIEDSLKRNIDYFLRNDFKICGIELTKHSESGTDFVVPHYHGFEYLGMTDKRDSKFYREHEEGWHLFNAEIQKNSELDENSKKNILKITNALENISDSEGWIRKSNKTLEPYFKKISNWNELVMTIKINGILNFHLTQISPDNPEKLEEFKTELSKLVPSKKEKLQTATLFFNVEPELWIPKIDEFIALFNKFYS